MKALFGNRGATAAPAPPVPQTRQVQDNNSIFGNGFFQRGNGGILPERGSPQQLEMVQAAVQAAMQAAPNSGSPLLAFLAPIVGGAAMSRATGLNSTYGNNATQASLDAYQAATGAPDNAMAILDLLSDPNMPDAAKKDLAKRFGMMVDPKTARRSGGGGSKVRAPSTSKPPTPQEKKDEMFGPGPDVMSGLDLNAAPGPAFPTGGPEFKVPTTDEDLLKMY